MSTPKTPSISPPPTPQPLSSAPSPPTSPSLSPTDIESASNTTPHYPHNPNDPDPDIHLDTARLRSTHSTAGYRDGISASKEQHLQTGFDEGYELGAYFGIRVGWVLGVLEGVGRAVNAGGRGADAGLAEGERDKELDEAKKMLKEAREALAVEKLFARQYWNADGTWGYEVRGSGGDGGDGEGDVTFLEVVEQHPLIVEWTRRAREEMKRWGIREGVFEGVEWEAGRVD